MNLAIRNAADTLVQNALRKLFAVLVGLILIGFLWAVPCFAQGLPTSPQGPTDAQELEAFLDDFFAKEMAKEHVPGAAVALVKDGKTFFSKGYGYIEGFYSTLGIHNSGTLGRDHRDLRRNEYKQSEH